MTLFFAWALLGFSQDHLKKQKRACSIRHTEQEEQQARRTDSPMENRRQEFVILLEEKGFACAERSENSFELEEAAAFVR